MFRITIWLFLLLIPFPSFAGDTDSSSVKVVPLISSNPTSGTGVGGVLSYVYQADAGSAPSQLMAGGQYTNTDSYNTFLVNRSYFNDDKLQSITGLIYIYNKSNFNYNADGIDFAIDIPEMTLPDLEGDIKFDVEVVSAGQMLLYEVFDDIYAGGHLFYISQDFSNPNTDGAVFLGAKGVEDSNRGAFGMDLAYDTRSKDDKFYPHDAIWVQFVGSAFLETLGVEEDYYTGVINARIYKRGFKPNDVWANQFFGKYVTENAPDGGLAALGARNVLRGFAIGQYKARFLSAIQTEYRYQIEETNFRIAAFAGAAILSGGSKGTTYDIPNVGVKTFNRDGDNGEYYSYGLGLRYTIQPEAGIDFRVDVATNSKGEQSIYAQINQAF